MAFPIREKLPADVTENRRNYWNLSNVLTLISMGAAFTGIAVAGAMQVGAAQEKIKAMEKQQDADRTQFNKNIRKIDDKIDAIDGNVNKVLRSLERMEGRREAEERNGGRTRK